jgi:ABC-type transport system involved in multi-copper enzyme maturation permease subunit
MKRIVTVAGLTIRDVLHRKVLYVFLALILVIVGMMTISLIVMSRMASTMQAKEVIDARSSMVLMVHSQLWSLGGLAFVVLTMVAISSEITQGTGVMLLSKAVRRHELFLGKILGVMAMAAVYGALSIGILAGLSRVIQGSVGPDFWLGELGSILGLIVAVASAGAFAAALGMVPALSFWLLAYIFRLPLTFLGQTNIPVVSHLSNALRYLYPATSLSDLMLRSTMFASTRHMSAWDLMMPILHLLDYSAVMLLIGIWLFSRRSLLVK